MNTLGWIHTTFGIIALVAGTAVVSLRKGTRWHRTLGHIYLTAMVSLNVSAFFIFRLYGHVGIFHWFAVVSLLTLAAGMVPLYTRHPKKRWLELHATFISGSYIGLVAATAAEVASRLPGLENAFGLVVAIASALVIGIGSIIMQRRLHHSLLRTPARIRQNKELSGQRKKQK